MDKYASIKNPFKRDAKGGTYEIQHGVWTRPELAFLAEAEWVWTEKVDGTNIRVLYNRRNMVEVRGRTDRAQLPGDLVENVWQMFPDVLPDEVWCDPDDTVCFYGEGYGPGIQKGGALYRDDKSFILFDVCINGSWVNWYTAKEIGAILGVPTVPEVGKGSIKEAIDFVGQGFNSIIAPHRRAEGLVLRPPVELINNRGNRVMVKVKDRDFGPKDA